jgi:predicted regulator of Ras-like GTPase activity (Roadblock/LC7/MglB family)
MSRDRELRDKRLVFYAQDVERLDSELDGFLELSSAKCALLIDKEGHMVTRRGEPLGASADSLAALAAGSFAATRELARLLGEEQFTCLFHQGSRDSIQLQLIGDRTLLAILFDQRTNLGLVRFYAAEAARHLDVILSEIAVRNAEPPPLSPQFQSDAQAALDRIL